MESTIIFFDQDNYNAVVSRLQSGALQLQALKNMYESLSFGEITFDEIQTLLSAPVVFIYDKINKEDKSMSPGFEMDKVKYMDMMKKPDWYPQLLHKVDQVNEFFSGNSTHPQARFLPSFSKNMHGYYQMNDQHEVEVIPQEVENLKSRFEEHSNSEESMKVIEFANRLFDLTRELGIIDISNSTGMRFDDFLGNLMPYSLVTKDVEIDKKFIRRFIKGMEKY